MKRISITDLRSAVAEYNKTAGDARIQIIEGDGGRELWVRQGKTMTRLFEEETPTPRDLYFLFKGWLSK